MPSIDKGADQAAALESIRRQLDDPYSAVSLEDPEKGIYVAGAIHAPYPRPSHAPFDTDQPAYRAADQLFRDTAAMIVGADRFKSCSISASTYPGRVERGEAQFNPKLHLDGLVGGPPAASEEKVRLLGLWSNLLPALVSNTPVEPDDFEGAYLESVKGVPIEVARPQTTELFAGQLCIIGANMPHTSQVSRRPWRVKRLLLRWQLSY